MGEYVFANGCSRRVSRKRNQFDANCTTKDPYASSTVFGVTSVVRNAPL